jgi:DNA polymerase-1
MPKTIKRTRDGFPTNAILGFIHFMNRIVCSQQNPFVGYALLDGGHSNRSQINTQYKSNRKPPPNPLKQQFPIVEQVPTLFGFETYRVIGKEADDLIATIVRLLADNPDITEIELYTMDKDSYQLLTYDKLKLIGPKLSNATEVTEKFGITPGQFIDYQALVGDKVDNIPGVKGIGAKTAVKLINMHSCIENIPIECFPGRDEGFRFAQESKDLAKLDQFVDIPNFTIEVAKKDEEKLKTFYEQYEIKKK